MSEETSAPKMSEETTAPKMSEETTDSKMSEETTAPEMSEETTAQKMSEETTDSKMSEETSAPKMSEETTAQKMSEETTDSKMSENTTAPIINEETTAQKMSEKTTALMLSEEITDSKMSENTTAPIISEETTDQEMSEETTAPKISEEITDHKMKEETTAPKMSEKNNDQEMKEETTASKMSEESTDEKMNEETTAPNMSVKITAPKISEEINAPKMSEENTDQEMSEETTAPKMIEENTDQEMKEETTAPKMSEENTDQEMSEETTAPKMNEESTDQEMSEETTAAGASKKITAPETEEKITAIGTVDPKVSSPPSTIGSTRSPVPKTGEKPADPETSTIITAPETDEADAEILDLSVSSSSKNIPLTSAPKATFNRRFKKPTKLLLSTTGQKKEEKKGNQKKDTKKNDDNMEANLTPQAKRLSNILKYSPSHNWVWYEFGDSLVDSAVQRGAYEMSNFMLEYSPKLKTPFLPRRGWQLLRRNLGKARRFSPAFIEMALKEVNRSRHFVRLLQQAKPVKREEHAFLEQIYRGVSLPLSVDAKVTTFLKGRGIVNGVITRFKPEDSTYEIKCVLNGEAKLFTVPDILIQSSEAFVRLPLAHLMKAIDPNEDIFKMDAIADGKGHYSDELLEAIVQVKKLLVAKKKVVLELAAKNDSRENDPKPKKGQSSTVGVTYAELYRINNEAMPPMRVLHEYLEEHNQKIKLQSAKARTTLERYLKCCHSAEVDLKNVEKKYGLKTKVPETRCLYQDLQTILYLTGELGGPNTDEIMVITDNLIAYMIKSQPGELGTQLEITFNELKPLRQRIVEKFKKDANKPSTSRQGPADKA